VNEIEAKKRKEEDREAVETDLGNLEEPSESGHLQRDLAGLRSDDPKDFLDCVVVAVDVFVDRLDLRERERKGREKGGGGVRGR
jgi:hypothetical protein